MRLDGKVAIITGAGSGIGRESACLFAREGAKVAVVDFVEAAGQATADLIGAAAMFIKADVSRWKDTHDMVHTAMARYGRLDILFNNAGIDLPLATTVVETEESDWDKIIEVNLKGVFLGIRHALPVMMKQRYGTIINTASRAGLVATPSEAAYCASKGGVVSLTRQLAVDYAAFNIRVNCLCPCGLENPTVDRCAFLGKSSAALEQRHTRVKANIPMGRLCTANDVARAALFLASDDSNFVTGTALAVDGGSICL